MLVQDVSVSSEGIDTLGLLLVHTVLEAGQGRGDGNVVMMMKMSQWKSVI